MNFFVPVFFPLHESTCQTSFKPVRYLHLKSVHCVSVMDAGFFPYHESSVLNIAVFEVELSNTVYLCSCSSIVDQTFTSVFQCFFFGDLFCELSSRRFVLFLHVEISNPIENLFQEALSAKTVLSFNKNSLFSKEFVVSSSLTPILPGCEFHHGCFGALNVTSVFES